MLSSLLGDDGAATEPLSPWRRPPLCGPALGGRVSATDRLSWWFRPAAEGRDPWDAYLEQEPGPLVEDAAPTPARLAAPPAERPPGRRAALRLLLDEPDEEMIDADAEAVVTCLYDFVHALGRGDVAAAIDGCVAPDYHTMEHDVEFDRDRLAEQLHAQLDRLRGFEVEVSLAEIPRPVLHPEGILVYAELQIEARRDGAHETIVHRRLAVFRQGADRGWRISAFAPV